MRRECRERFPRHILQGKLLVNCSGMHHGTCVRDARAVMHVGIANPRWQEKTFPAFPAHAQPAILLICQEAHCENETNKPEMKQLTTTIVKGYLCRVLRETSLMLSCERGLR